MSEIIAIVCVHNCVTVGVSLGLDFGVCALFHDFRGIKRFPRPMGLTYTNSTTRIM